MNEELLLLAFVSVIVSSSVGFIFMRMNRIEKKSLSEDEIEERLNELEMMCADEKNLRIECEKKNRELKGQLLKKITLLTTTSETLKELQRKAPTLSAQDMIDNLKNQLEIKNRELKELKNEKICQ